MVHSSHLALDYIPYVLYIPMVIVGNIQITIENSIESSITAALY